MDSEENVKSKAYKTVGFKLGCCILLFAAAAQADIVSLTLNPNFPSQYAFYSYTSVGGSTETDPVAPYLITLTDTDGTLDDTAEYGICWDINNDTPVGTAYTGQLEAVYGTTAGLEASYLANLLYLGGGLAAPLQTRGAISLAIWEIMYATSTDSNGHPFLPSDYDPAAQPYVDQAVAAVAAGQWTPWEASFYPTWVPDDPAMQRFGIIFADNPPLTSPEPGGLALLGSGLICFAWLWRRHTGFVRK